jgi:hypothetical protein
MAKTSTNVRIQCYFTILSTLELTECINILFSYNTK